jgi:hypothetical protein
LPYFNLVIPECRSGIVSHPPLLPSHLGSFSSPSLRPGITSLLSVIMSLSCPPSLTMSGTLVVVRVSHSHNKCTPCYLTSSLLPCLLLAFKNKRSSKMILQIVAPLVASIGAAATLKQDLCVSPMAPSFSIVCCRCNLSPRRNRISIAFGNDGKLDLSLGLVREGECGFWCTAKPFPPHRQRDNVCNALA